MTVGTGLPLPRTHTEWHGRYMDLGSRQLRRQIRCYCVLVSLMRAYFNICCNTSHDRHAIDALIQHNFAPTRTFVWAYGFDEEASGLQVRCHCLYCPRDAYISHRALDISLPTWSKSTALTHSSSPGRRSMGPSRFVASQSSGGCSLLAKPASQLPAAARHNFALASKWCPIMKPFKFIEARHWQPALAAPWSGSASPAQPFCLSPPRQLSSFQ